MNGYIKLPKTKIIPDSSIKKQQLSDDVWINYIFYIILKYSSTDKTEILNLIQKELKKEQSRIEEIIKNHIYIWYQKVKKTDKQIGIWRIILKLEPKTDSLKGYYDLQFLHSDWDKYFAFEAKNLGKIKRMTQSASINEYIYNPTKKDGGMYRFFTGKYACDLEFGGMLGFVIGEIKGDIMQEILSRIQDIYSTNSNGKLIDDKFILNSISGNKNTLTTIHSRNGKKFKLYHILVYLNI